ncbi:hypothetical protein LSAT2_012907 [Lamellibrachia satsuma]|nr:hypothetical protein LSAT2_012907 [Lamellibrachia satsuma]
MYRPTYDKGVRSLRKPAPYHVVPLNETSQQRRDVNTTSNQSGYSYGVSTNGRSRPPYDVNHTSYDMKQTNNWPQVFGDTNTTGQRLCQYNNTNRATDIPEDISHTKSSLTSFDVTNASPNQQQKPQRPVTPARGIRRSSLSGQSRRGDPTRGSSLPKDADAKSKRSGPTKPTTKPTPEKAQTKALKRPSVVVTESTYLNLAVVVTVFFNIPLGLLAVAIAMRSATAYRSHRVERGRRYATLALVVSLLGVVTTVAAVMAAVQHVTSRTDDVT